MDGMEHPYWLFIYCKNNLASSMHSRIYWRIVDLWAERLIVLIYLFQNLTGGYATLESRLDEAHHLIKIRLTEIIQARIWDFWSSSSWYLDNWTPSSLHKSSRNPRMVFYYGEPSLPSLGLAWYVFYYGVHILWRTSELQCVLLCRSHLKSFCD
jgi:hypothetical protein